MKRYRHYTKDRAIALSCFGSVVEQDKYLELKEVVAKEFRDCDLFLSFSSRMVLKHLQKRGEIYKNLPQTLADIDMLGYKNIIVASINLFPTDEHHFLKKIVEGFKNFSLANIRNTDAIFTKTKETSIFLKELNDSVTKNQTANLYIIHGTPRFDNLAIASIEYAERFLESISDFNFTCSLEGAYPFFCYQR